MSETYGAFFVRGFFEHPVTKKYARQSPLFGSLF